MLLLPLLFVLTVADPPFHGTIFDFPKLMTEADPTALTKVTFLKRDQREMFDRRIDRFSKYDVFLFKAEFIDHEPIEVAVNREFQTEAEAQRQAEFYAAAFGRLPQLLRANIEALHIQDGKQLFGGGRRILIHTQQGEEYQRDGILEEALAHEAAHALDQEHAKHPAWRQAQRQDANFISAYASENPDREDIAESIVPYFAVRFRPERIEARHRQLINQLIPARLAYFDTLKPSGFPTQKL